MNQIILHVDMDAFYASVEIRDDPSLKGKPLIIGSLPSERGVVATCSYEARKFGVHSGMNIKDAYRMCPQGIYKHPDFEKYREVSRQLHRIWDAYATASEAIALDEAYLDLTDRAGNWEEAREIARTIKRRTFEELRLTCSVGLAYSKTAAKTASEEKKPDGYYEIPTAQDFVDLILERDVQVLYTVGEKTAQKLHAAGIHKVRDIRERQEEVVRLLGKQGRWVTQIAFGIDERKVTPYHPEDAKSIGREITFQEDVNDYAFLKEVLFLLSLSVENRSRRVGLHGKGITLKLTYANMKGITRSRVVPACDSAVVIYQESGKMLEQVEKRPVRLIGVSLYNLSGEEGRQLTFDDLDEEKALAREAEQERLLAELGERYHLDFAGHLEQLYHAQTLHKTVEYMRKHR
ncbi:MAG: DNA polymerase IV [Oscillospiraceae bacterium]|nr:DNA polymerase IV [Oscillospiraceae bacterium]